LKKLREKKKGVNRNHQHQESFRTPSLEIVEKEEKVHQSPSPTTRKF
jgi:hypothetical protein